MLVRGALRMPPRESPNGGSGDESTTITD